VRLDTDYRSRELNVDAQGPRNSFELLGDLTHTTNRDIPVSSSVTNYVVEEANICPLVLTQCISEISDQPVGENNSAKSIIGY
jgi:hypothetical protein